MIYVSAAVSLVLLDLLAFCVHVCVGMLRPLPFFLFAPASPVSVLLGQLRRNVACLQSQDKLQVIDRQKRRGVGGGSVFLKEM